MPKRTREDFLSIQKLHATVDGLDADATPAQVASRCASAMKETLGARAVVIHLRDVVTTAREAFAVLRQGKCVASIEVTGVEEDRRQSVEDACAIVAQRIVVAFDAAAEREAIEAELPLTRRSPELPRASLGSSHRNLVTNEGRLVGRCAEREDRAAHIVPATFPKRAPTLHPRSLF